jgi:hypothetical protein
MLSCGASTSENPILRRSQEFTFSNSRVNCVSLTVGRPFRFTPINRHSWCSVAYLQWAMVRVGCGAVRECSTLCGGLSLYVSHSFCGRAEKGSIMTLLQSDPVLPPCPGAQWSLVDELVRWWSVVKRADLGGVDLLSEPAAPLLMAPGIDVFYRGPKKNLWIN